MWQRGYAAVNRAVPSAHCSGGNVPKRHLAADGAAWIKLGGYIPHDAKDLTRGKVSRQGDGKLRLAKDVKRLGRLAVSGLGGSGCYATALAHEIFSLAQICTLNELRQLKQLKFLREGSEQHYHRLFRGGD